MVRIRLSQTLPVRYRGAELQWYFVAMTLDSSNRQRVLFRHVQIFDGVADVIINGDGPVLMPGAGDAHVRLVGNANGQMEMISGLRPMLAANTVATSAISKGGRTYQHTL